MPCCLADSWLDKDLFGRNSGQPEPARPGACKARAPAAAPRLHGPVCRPFGAGWPGANYQAGYPLSPRLRRPLQPARAGAPANRSVNEPVHNAAGSGMALDKREPADIRNRFRVDDSSIPEELLFLCAGRCLAIHSADHPGPDAPGSWRSRKPEVRFAKPPAQPDRAQGAPGPVECPAEPVFDFARSRCQGRQPCAERPAPGSARRAVP